ncbi:MAG: response regulator transcription factor [Myxococcota bacterium]
MTEPLDGPIRTVVVEDDRRYRTALCSVLESTPEFALAAEFDAAGPMLEVARGARPPWDLVILDIHLPDQSGIAATRALKRAVPGLPVVNLTVFDEPSTILEAIHAGADGYLLKSTPLDDMLDGLIGVIRGGSALTPAVARTVLSLVRGASPQPKASAGVLSDREQQVLRDLARGLQCKQIASDHGLSIHTVRTYVRRIYEKLQVGTLAEAVAAAIQSGIL